MVALNWSLPEGVYAAVTTATEPGNLAAHVGAEPSSVIRHRRQLQRQLQLPCAPRWLRQVHSNKIINFNTARPTVSADGIYANSPSAVCAVLTADCLPILLCSNDGQEIAAVHAGWRGLAAGVVENSLAQFKAPPQHILAFIGPAISVQAFEVGKDVRTTFLKQGIVDSQTFQVLSDKKWLADLPLLAQRILGNAGCHNVQLSHWCTYSDPQWCSYRRDPNCGRIASLIWKK